jgi:hypothetical protein
MERYYTIETTSIQVSHQSSKIFLLPFVYSLYQDQEKKVKNVNNHGPAGWFSHLFTQAECCKTAQRFIALLKCPKVKSKY